MRKRRAKRRIARIVVLKLKKKKKKKCRTRANLLPSSFLLESAFLIAKITERKNGKKRRERQKFEEEEIPDNNFPHFLISRRAFRSWKDGKTREREREEDKELRDKFSRESREHRKFRLIWNGAPSRFLRLSTGRNYSTTESSDHRDIPASRKLDRRDLQFSIIISSPDFERLHDRRSTDFHGVQRRIICFGRKEKEKSFRVFYPA